MRLLGHTGSQGSLREVGRDKLAQVVAFLPLLKDVLARTGRRTRLNVLECACGKGHLSLLLNQMLSEAVGRDVHWIGIDSSSVLIGKCRAIAESMGFTNVEYHRSSILDYEDDRPIPVLIALHACDTATDEAIVKALQLGCRFVFLVPCCQREVSNQLRAIRDPRYLPMIGNYTHRKILGTLLTDSLRRLALESFGYETDVFEYVSVRRTEKNIMMRAVRGTRIRRESWELFRTTLDDLHLDLTLDRLLRERGIRPSFAG